MATTRPRLSGALGNIAWGTLWLAFLACILAWAFWTIALVTVDMIFRGLTRGDYLDLLELFSLVPLALCAVFISLRRRRFDLPSTVIILGAVLVLAWQSNRFADVVVALDVLALALVLAAATRRNAGATIALVVTSAVVATTWLAMTGKLSRDELTYAQPVSPAFSSDHLVTNMHATQSHEAAQ